MPGKSVQNSDRYQNERKMKNERRIPKKKKNPNFIQDSSRHNSSDSDTESTLSTSRTYCSTCTQTSETNTIDSQNRVIRRKFNSSRKSRVDQYRISGRNEQKLKEYIVTKSGAYDPRDIRTNTDGKRVIVRKIRERPSSNDDRIIRVVPRTYDERIVRRPRSYDERIEGRDGNVRVVRYRASSYDGIDRIREMNNYNGGQRKYVVLKRSSSHDSGQNRLVTIRKANSYTGLSDRVVVRKRPQTAVQPIRQVVQKTIRQENLRNVHRNKEVSYKPVVESESSEESGSETEFSETPARPSSYHPETEKKIIRVNRPSSYHEGMSKDYEAVPQKEEHVDISHNKGAIREYKLQNEPDRSRAVKQYAGDKWVDEYEVDTAVEKREVGVQMTTKFVLPPLPPKPKTRNVGTQTKQKKPPPKPVTPPPPPPPRTPTPPLPPPPSPPPAPKIKEKSRYVRVGGGWMKIDHYRNHHVPLKIFEHTRTKDDKYLSIKYRYTKDKRNTPKAWSKYRSCVAFDS